MSHSNVPSIGDRVRWALSAFNRAKQQHADDTQAMCAALFAAGMVNPHDLHEMHRAENRAPTHPLYESTPTMRAAQSVVDAGGLDKWPANPTNKPTPDRCISISDCRHSKGSCLSVGYCLGGRANTGGKKL